MKNSIFFSFILILMLIAYKTSHSLNTNIIDSVSIDSLIFSVKDLSGEQKVNKYGINTVISKRQYNSTGNLIAENYLFEKGIEFGYNTSRQNCQETCNNIIWESEGTLYSDSIVIIGAHFDSYNLDDPDGYMNLLSPGADDNASGCAAIIEIARLLKNYKPIYKMKFIFWDEEERGLYGSYYYSNLAKENGEKIKLYINLDMIGWDNDNDGMMEIQFLDTNTSVFYATQAIKFCNDYHLVLLPKLRNGEAGSDIHNFWDNGYSAIGFSDMIDYYSFVHSQNDLIGSFNFDYFLNNSKFALAIIMNNAYDVKTDVTDNFINDKLSLYPNPATDYLNVITKSEKSKFEIYSIIGKNILETNNKSVDVSHFPTGIYFLKSGNLVSMFVKY
ncbi:MAG: M20/M25/M40 family metallo-hydrolase [Bacteroidetes bacterium]|nr:MAG: M20/M25/M40 family metallo-hydrolase [Bacteroidota bacterium]